MMMNDDLSRQPAPTDRAACDELRDLLPAYVIGATTAAEAVRVRELLAVCPEHEGDIATYAALSEGFVAGVEAIQPAAHVRGSLLARLAEEEASSAAQPPAPTLVTRAIRPERRARPSVWWAAAAAAVVLLIATNVLWLARIGDYQRDLAALQQEQQQLIAILGDADVQRIAVNSTADETQVATVLWNPRTNAAILYTDALPALDSDRTYQLWVIGAGGAESAGIFRTRAAGTSFHSFEPADSLTDYQAIGISIEPAAGSEQPTADPLAVGAIPAAT